MQVFFYQQHDYVSPQSHKILAQLIKNHGLHLNIFTCSLCVTTGSCCKRLLDAAEGCCPTNGNKGIIFYFGTSDLKWHLCLSIRVLSKSEYTLVFWWTITNVSSSWYWRCVVEKSVSSSGKCLQSSSRIDSQDSRQTGCERAALCSWCVLVAQHKKTTYISLLWE